VSSANHAGRRYVSHISKCCPQHPVLVHLQHVFTFIRSHVTSVTSEYGNGSVQHTAKSEVFTTGWWWLKSSGMWRRVIWLIPTYRRCLPPRSSGSKRRKLFGFKDGGNPLHRNIETTFHISSFKSSWNTVFKDNVISVLCAVWIGMAYCSCSSTHC